jgi:FkbM family methyltransferase
MTGNRASFPIAGEYRQEILRSDDGLLWIIGHGTADALTIWHEMDPPGASIHEFICSKFTDGGVFLDVGAHEGHYAVRAAKAGMTVYAVEANPETVQQLVLNCHLNDLHVHIWAVAAWDSRTLLEFNALPGAVMRNGSASLMAQDGMEPMGMTVAALPLDELCETLPRLDLIKMDVEGSDCHVLDGMMRTIIHFRPFLIFEDHSWAGVYDFHEMRARERRLEKFGYTWSDAARQGVKTKDRYRVGVPRETPPAAT